MSSVDIVIVDSDGLNPYGRCLAEAVVGATEQSVHYIRRRAPVDSPFGTVFGPIRGGSSPRPLRALQLAGALALVVARARRARSVLVQWDTAGDALLALTLRLLGCSRVVVTLHDPRRVGMNQRIARWIFARVGHRIVMHSRDLADEYTEAAGVDRSRIVVLPLPGTGGQHEKSVASSRASLGLPAEARIVLFFGQIRPYKGIDTLADAMDIVLATRRDVHLVVAGTVKDAALECTLDALRADHPESVTLLTGPTPLGEEVIADALNASDLVVLPFSSASQSASVVHALSYGRPVLTTRVGDLARLSDLGVVRAVPPDDARELSRSCIELLDDSAMRSGLADAGSLFVRTELDAEEIGARLVSELEAR